MLVRSKPFSGLFEPLYKFIEMPYTLHTRSKLITRLPTLVVCASLAPLVIAHLANLMRQEYYQYAPVILLVCGWLLYVQLSSLVRHGLRLTNTCVKINHSTSSVAIDDNAAQYGQGDEEVRKQGVSVRPRDSYFRRRTLSQMSFVVFGYMSILAGALLLSPTMGMIGAVLVLGSILLYLCVGRRVYIFRAWLLLWLLIPLPFGLDRRLAVELQHLASSSASVVLDLLGVMHLRIGHIIWVPGKQFFVEEACSGIHSLFALFSCVAIGCVVLNRPWFHTLLLLVSSIAGSIVMNIFRLVLIIDLHGTYRIDLTTGWMHSVFGAALFLITLVLLFSMDQLVRWLIEMPLLPEWESDLGDPLDVTKSGVGLASTVVRPSPINRWKTAVCFLFADSVLLIQVVSASNVDSKQSTFDVALSKSIQKAWLSRSIDQWTMRDYQTNERKSNSVFGRHSATWRYEHDQLLVTVSCDFPFANYHHLLVCYEGLGWTMTDYQVANDASGASIVTIQMQSSTGEYGILVFSEFAKGGGWQSPPTNGLSVVLSWLHNRFFTIRYGLVGDLEDVIQVQAMATNDVSFTSDEKATVNELFRSCLSRLRERIVEMSLSEGS